MPDPALLRTRVWRQLQEEHRVTQAGDSVIRIALTAMALDPDSGMSEAQRAWALGLSTQRVTPFSKAELAKIRGPLLAWVRQRLPGCAGVIEQQFGAREKEI